MAETSTSARQGFGGPAAKGRRLAPSLAVSLLAHLLLLALAILLARRQAEAPEWLPPPAFEVVPDGGGASRPSVAAPEPKPTPETPPEPAPAPPPAPVPAAPSTPAPSAAPEMSLTPPVPAEPALPHFEMPESPAKPAAPPPLAPHLAFPTPMAYSLGTPMPRSSPQRRAGRGIDVSLGQGITGAANTKIFGRSDSQEVGPDWYNRFAAWWNRHGYYPPQAGRNGEQGDVVLDLLVLRSGQVEKVALTSRSGSQWLDIAALSVFRDARLPPLPATAAASVPITLKIHYQILR